MYYLLKLEVNQKIPKGAVVISRQEYSGVIYRMFDADKKFNRIEHDFSGTLWDGEEVFGSISEKYEIDDTIKKDIYDIFPSFMTTGDDYVSDEVYVSLKDLLEDDLMEQWDNLDEPIVFLMEINGVSTWTDCGEEWDIENFSVKVITQDDLKRLTR